MQPKRFLVVEDEFLVALDIEAILMDAGFEVMGPAANVAEALRLLAARLPDAALLDNNLNGHSVGEVATTLDAHGVPFAFVTGNDRTALPPAFADAPMMRKPFDPARLLGMARALITASR